MRLAKLLLILILLLAAAASRSGPAAAQDKLFEGFGFNPGRALVERLLSQATGGPVAITGLGGRFPDEIRMERLELSDRDGTWLVAEGVELDWSPSRLFQREAEIDRLVADRIEVRRLRASDPAPAAQSPADAAQPPSDFPVRIALRELRVARLELGAPVIGTALAVSAEGSAQVQSLQDGTVDLRLGWLEGRGAYALRGTMTPEAVTATLTLDEEARGLVSQLAGLPDLGPVTLNLSLDGPRTAEAAQLALTAGELRAEASGTVDLVNFAADLDVTANAPTMTPRPDLSWQAVALQARVRGPLARPNARGTFRLEGFAASGAAVRLLTADLDGDLGHVNLRAAAEGLRLPGPAPDLLAGAPLLLRADAVLDDPARPVTFDLAHPLLTAAGRAQTSGDLSATADLTAPNLAPLAAVGGVDLQGGAALTLRASVQGSATRVELDAALDVTGGQAPAPALLGRTATLALAATLNGADVVLDRAAVNGEAVSLQASGALRSGQTDFTAQLGLPRLAALAPAVEGHADLQLRAQGPTDNLSVVADAAGEVGTAAVPRGPLRLHVDASGLPGAPTGRATAEGTLDGAPLTLNLTAQRETDGTLRAVIERADWRSAHAEGALTLPPGAALPQGRVEARITRLADLERLLGQAVAGSVQAQATFDPGQAHVEAEGAVSASGARVGRFALDARVADPAGQRAVTAHATLDGLNAGGFAGTVRADVSGPQDALAVRANARGRLADADLALTAAAVVNAPAQQVRLSALEATWRGETARLLAPAELRLAGGAAVDRLRLGLRGIVLEAAGRAAPTLDLTASLRGPAADFGALAGAAAGPDLAAQLAADGTVSADARLTGTPGRPGGTVRLNVSGLRARTGPGRALPLANLDLTAQLAGGAARIDGRLAAGPNVRLAVTGTAPTGGAGPLDLRANGAFDLAVLDPFIAAGGRRVRGRLALDGGVAGTVAAPRPFGTATLANGEVQDFAQGVRLDNIAATVRADGDTLRLASFTSRAGPGTISASGSVGVLAPGKPVDLQITMRRARPLASDRLTADLDADLAVRGALGGDLRLGGRITVLTAEVRVPERLPVTVATLDVRRPGDKPEPPPVAPTPLGLDLTVSAPRAIFVRGRGLDAELSGDLTVAGTSAAPQVGGGFEMRRGTLSVAGTTLTFTRGRVSFDGDGLSGRIDPSLDFVAESATSSVVARLTVGGYASAPKITLSSTPELPQDEVLAYLLFRRSAKELGPFQIAGIAAGLAELSGVGGGGANPLDRVRRGLGLDRLTVGDSSTPGSTAPGNTTPTVEGGRYIANGVYLGAKQGTTGGTPRATMQIDITKGLKLETELGAGTGGNSVGLLYQFEY